MSILQYVKDKFKPRGTLSELDVVIKDNLKLAEYDGWGVYEYKDTGTLSVRHASWCCVNYLKVYDFAKQKHVEIDNNAVSGTLSAVSTNASVTKNEINGICHLPGAVQSAVIPLCVDNGNHAGIKILQLTINMMRDSDEYIRVDGIIGGKTIEFTALRYRDHGEFFIKMMAVKQQQFVATSSGSRS